MTHPTSGGARADFSGSKIKKSGKCHELPRKSLIFVKPHPTPGGPSGDFRGSTIQKSGKCHGLPRKLIICVNPHSTLWLGVLGLKISNQKSRKFHELQRKWFHFKPITPTHPGGAVLGDTGREGGRKGGREKEGRSKVAGREEGGMREEGRREGGGREEGRHEGGLR